MTPEQRDHAHRLMRLLLDHEPQVHYPHDDVRGPLDASTFALTEEGLRHRLERGEGITFDCSQSTAQILIWTGLKAIWLHARYPNGVPVVYTGTMLGHLRHYSDPSAAHVAALVVYGPGTGEHVSMVYQPGPDPLLWSHGLEGGPQLVRLSRQRSYHHGPVTFLSTAELT